MIVVGLFLLDIMKQPAAILVLPVLPVFYQNLPVSAILVQILVNTSIPVSSSICNTRRYLSLPKCVLQIPKDSGKYWLYQYCRYWKILENIGNTSIADTGRFWKILVIPVLQILEDQVRSCGMYIGFFCPVCASAMRGRSVQGALEKGDQGQEKGEEGGKRGKEGREKGEVRWEK